MIIVFYWVTYLSEYSKTKFNMSEDVSEVERHGENPSTEQEHSGTVDPKTTTTKTEANINDSKRTDPKIIDCLNVGAGSNPHPDATATLDLRTDIEGIDFPGIDIARDELPMPDASVHRIVCQHVLEDIQRRGLTTLFRS
jgi:hypothetical protein